MVGEVAVIVHLFGKGRKERICRCGHKPPSSCVRCSSNGGVSHNLTNRCLSIIAVRLSHDLACATIWQSTAH